MWTISDLGKKIKAEHPGELDDLTDEQVGRAAIREAKARGSNEYDMYGDEDEVEMSMVENPEPESRSASPFENLNPNHDSKIQHIRDSTDPKMGGMVAWFKRLSSEARGKFFRATNEEQQALLAQAVIITDHVA